MLTFETYRQYLQACTERTVNSHRPPAGPYFWTCETCGKCAPNSDSYGTRRDDTMHCYDCCHAADVAELLDQSKPFGAYLSKLPGGQRIVSNWPGGRLGDVHALSFSRSGWHGAEIARFHVRDVHGQWWQGRGAGDGMCCTLRKMKQPAYAARWGVK